MKPAESDADLVSATYTNGDFNHSIKNEPKHSNAGAFLEPEIIIVVCFSRFI